MGFRLWDLGFTDVSFVASYKHKGFSATVGVCLRYGGLRGLSRAGEGLGSELFRAFVAWGFLCLALEECGLGLRVFRSVV